MDRAITASDANQHFSEMLRDVQAGQRFVVISHGRPVAKVSPIDDLDQQSAGIDALLDFRRRASEPAWWRVAARRPLRVTRIALDTNCRGRSH